MAALVNQYGREIQSEDEDLDREIAGPTLAGIRSPWFESVATGLTPARLANVIRQVDEGDALQYLTLAEEMEERDLHYYSELSKRKLAVSSLEMNVEAWDASAEAEKHADFVRDVLTSDDAVHLISDLLDALGKGYSVCEIMWDRSSKEYWPSKFIHRDPRFFRFNWETGQEIRLLDESNPAFGIPLAPYKFVYHRPHLKTGLPIRGGLARLACIAFMCKGYTLKDWLAFAEVFGMPLRVGKYHAAARPEEKAALLRAVSNIGTDAAGIIPDNMLIEFIQSSSSAGGDKLFLNLAEYLDKQVSKGVVGQVASSEGTPGKLGGDDAQENVRRDIWTSDAKQLALTLKRDVVKACIDLNFGPQPRGHYPKVRFPTDEAEDLAKFSTAITPFIDRGLPVEAAVVADKFGLEMPDSVDPKMLLTPAGGGMMTEMGPDGEPLEEEVPPEDEEQYLQSLNRAQLIALASRSLNPHEKLVQQELEGWRKVTDPALKPVIALARTAKTKEDFLAGLKKLRVKKGTQAATVAIATFKARIQAQEEANAE